MTRLDSPLYGRMIFVVGARRSGTNWLQRIIATHPDVLAVPSETHLFSHGLAELNQRFQHALPTSGSTGQVYMERPALLDAMRDFCDQVFGRLAAAIGPDKARICERTPLHAQHLDLIGEVYPDAAVVHIIRDGRDAARSLLAQPWGPATMAEAAREWASTVGAARTARAPWYREVRYEALFADPVGGADELFSWLDLPVDAPLLERVRAEAAVSYNTDAGRPELTVAKWGPALTPSEREAFEAEAGELNRALGYGEPPSPHPVRHGAASRGGLRQASGRVVGRLRRRVTSAPAAPAALPDPEVLATTVSEFIAATGLGRVEALLDFVSEDTSVVVVDSAGQRTGRGAAGVALLADSMPAPGGGRHQVRGEVHYTSATSATVVLGHEDGAGAVKDTVFLISLATGTARLANLVYYAFPLTAPGPASSLGTPASSSGPPLSS
ncbi:MAG TPA: sulfotransferase [Acidimicrobiales bacterium]|nr:sulfotransferase [Acidimicrobiales bacterium]